MGWVMVTIIALIAGFTLLGLKRGFVKVVIGLASMFIAIVGAALLTKPVGAFLDKNTGIRASIDKTIVSFVDEQIENAKQEAMKAAGVKDESELKIDDLVKEIDELPLPSSVRDVITDAAKKDVAATGHAAAKEAAEKLSDAVINGIAFIGCFIVLLIALIITRTRAVERSTRRRFGICRRHSSRLAILCRHYGFRRPGLGAGCAKADKRQ